MKLADLQINMNESIVASRLKQKLYKAIEYMGDDQQASQEFLDTYNQLKQEVGDVEAQRIMTALKNHHKRQNRTGEKNDASDARPQKRVGAVKNN